MESKLQLLLGVFVLGAVLALLFLLRWFFEPIRVAKRSRRAPSLAIEASYVDPRTDQRVEFPRLIDRPSVKLTVVLPAYNEEDRLPLTIQKTAAYLEGRKQKDRNFTFEVIIVDDGSKDKTADVALKLSKKYLSLNIKLLKLEHNNGKGGAIRKAVLRSSGEYILFADADAATEIEDLEKLEGSLKKYSQEALVAVGSRAHLEEDALAKRAWYRNILMKGFHMLVSICVPTGVRDTQCGFKLFSRKAAQLLFYCMHIERWSFDVELLYLARMNNMPVTEVPVRWTEVPGSKISLAQASLTMARELAVTRLCYMFGIWTIDDGKYRIPQQ